MEAKLVVHPVFFIFGHCLRDNLGFEVAQTCEGLILTAFSVLRLVYKLLPLESQRGKLGLHLNIALIQERPNLGLLEAKQVSPQQLILFPRFLKSLGLSLSHGLFEGGIDR